MYKNGLRTIVVLASDLQDEYNREVCHYMSIRAKKLGYNLAILHWNNPYQGQSDSFVDGESSILNIIEDYSKVDAIVYLKDVVNNPKLEALIDEQIMKHVQGPKVSLRLPIDGFYNIMVNDAAGMENIIRHFVEKHGCKKIAYMSGKKGMRDAKTRLDLYKRLMDEYNLEYDDSYIYHGNFWKEYGDEAVEHFFSSPLGMPEAIVCANDYMAFAVMDALVTRGYKIPDDIMVSGFDNAENDKEYMISLTTADVPYHTLAQKAIEVIDEYYKGKSPSHEVYIDAVMIEGESCGCAKSDRWSIIVKKESIREIDKNLLSQHIRSFTVALQNTDSLDDIINAVDNHMYMNGNYKNYFLCMQYEDVQMDFEHALSKTNGFTSSSICSLALCDRKRIDLESKIFPTCDLIPEEFVDETPQIYCFGAIHFLDKVYGYAAISFADYKGLQNDYYSFAVHLGNALDDLDKKCELKKALKEVQELYISDPLTGLFNRRGFETKSIKMFAECISLQQPFAIMTLDMDNLKGINDTLGHMQGDLAITVLADALKYASNGEELCARVGGDEFNVFAKGYDEEKGNIFVSKVYEYLSNYNRNSGAEFNVHTSYGLVIISEDMEKYPLEYYIKLSDIKMYDHKSSKAYSRK